MKKTETVWERLEREKEERLKKRQAHIEYMLKLWGKKPLIIPQKPFYC